MGVGAPQGSGCLKGSGRTEGGVRGPHWPPWRRSRGCTHGPPAQPKGADRKQKTDREKVEKQPALEREKFQPAYENTVLAEVGLDPGTPPCGSGCPPPPGPYSPLTPLPPSSVCPMAGHAGCTPQPPRDPGAAVSSLLQAAEP